MEVIAPGSAPAAAHASARVPLVRRHSLATRITHWVAALSLLVLVMSGLQIFNAAPYLDASDKSDPGRRVFAVNAGTDARGAPFGSVTVFGHTFRTTHVLGYTDDSQGGEAPRAFPGWATLPGYQDLADGRVWHLFFAWVFIVCGLVYTLAGVLHRDLRLVILRPSDLPKLWPMQAYYLHLRPAPPQHGKYNPLQKLVYTSVLFVLAPLIVLSGLALSPGVDAIAGPLTTVFGGRQFARLWHFVFMLAFIGFFFGHMFLVATTGVGNNLRSMLTGRYRPHPGEGTGP